MGPRRFPQQKKRKEKLVLVFDENARREYLTGFRKRNLQRRQKAAEKLEMQLKLERKRIKAEKKLMYQRLAQSSKPIPEISHLISEEIDMGEHQVSVMEMTPMSTKQGWIGQNEVQYEEEEEQDTAKEDDNPVLDGIEGMELKRPKPQKKGDNFNGKLKSKKDLKKAIKKKTTQFVQNSKFYKAKSKISTIKDKRRKKREEKKRARLLNKKNRIQTDD